MIDCRFIIPTSRHTVKYFFVYTSAITASEKSRQKGGLQRFVTAIAASVASQLLHRVEKALGHCPALQAEALRRDEFSQVPVERSGHQISAHTGKILSAADPPCALQMVQLEGVTPKPMGKTGEKDAVFRKGVPECRLQARFENTKCSGLGHALQQNKNYMFRRCGGPVSLGRTVIPCIASLMEENGSPGDISDHLHLYVILSFFQIVFRSYFIFA